MPQSVHGILKEQRYTYLPDQNGVQLALTFAVSGDFPFFLWKISVTNHGSGDVHARSIDLLRIEGGSENALGEISFGQSNESCSPIFFSNGWQSWSYTGIYTAEERQRKSLLSFIPNANAWNPGTSYPHHVGEFRSEFFGVVADRVSRNALLVGSLSQREQFTILEADLKRDLTIRFWADCDDVRLPPGEKLETDWAVLYCFCMDRQDPLGPYLDGVARENCVRQCKEIPAGWCSWYEYYTKVSADDIEDNLLLLKSMHDRLPLNLLQIDDGFQAAGGDWLQFNQRFAGGVAPLAEEIRKQSFTPGLWLAPFIANRGSELLKKHPEFILRNEKGIPILAGIISNRMAVALDLTYPNALEYCTSVIHTAVEEWGFPYLKLDFLYAAALRGKYHVDTLTRAQVLRKSLQALRDAAGEQAFLLGCGIPLGSAVGIFDSVRIGADTASTWHPELFNIPVVLKKETTLPCLRNATQNILTRASLHNRWWINDPDCLLLREETKLSQDEIESHATLIGMTGGAMMLSDDMQKVPDNRLQIAQALLPLIGKRAEVLDIFEHSRPHLLKLDLEGAIGSWFLCACFNWQDSSQKYSLMRSDFRLPEQPFWVSSFWQRQQYQSMPGQAVFSGEIKPHGVVLLSIKPVITNTPQYIGSNLHISQGLEVQDWKTSQSELSLKIGATYRRVGSINIQIPGDVQEATLDQTNLSWRSTGKQLYQFPLSIEGKGEIRVSWK